MSVSISCGEALAKTPEAKANAAFQAMIVEAIQHLPSELLRELAGCAEYQLLRHYDCVGYGYVTNCRDHGLEDLARIYGDAGYCQTLQAQTRKAYKAAELGRLAIKVAETLDA